MKNNEHKTCKYSFNPYRQEAPDWNKAEYAFLKSSDMLDFHKTIPGYEPTPLTALPNLTKKLGMKEIFVKDESFRFGIKAFKALGASYAIHRFLQRAASAPGESSFTFCAATDGNHGRAVAWTARRLKQKAVIYMPEDTARSGIENVEAEGAKVELVPGTFDDCVEKCAADAEKNGWQAISDTAYPGYFEIPQYIMLGYTTIFREMEGILHKENDAGIDFLFLPAGVGGIAAAGSSYYTLKYKTAGAGPQPMNVDETISSQLKEVRKKTISPQTGSTGKRPKLICVEPAACDCFLESIRFGKGSPLPARGKPESIMVGLNCGIPSPAAWPVIRDSMDLFIGITDNYAVAAMREYYKENVTSGESGASGLAGLLALLQDKRLRDAKKQIGLNSDSRVLLINTEGDTDPVNYQKIVR